MIKHYFICFSLLLSLNLAGQTLPNSGFEDWHGILNGNENPDYWISSMEFIALGGNSCILKSTDSHSGQYAAKIVPQTITIMGETATTYGFMQLDATPQISEQPYPFASRPDSIVVWIKYIPQGDNQYMIRADLTKWNENQQDYFPVGVAGYVGVATGNTYQRISFPFQYSSPEIPDSMYLTFYTGVFEPHEQGTELYVDDISIITNTPVGLNEREFQGELRCYPNPADKLLTLHTDNPEPISVYNAMGTEIAVILPIAGEITEFQTQFLENGVYFLKSINQQSQKLVVQHF